MHLLVKFRKEGLNYWGKPVIFIPHKYVVVASFPGSPLARTKNRKEATESWAGPGNEARPNYQSQRNDNNYYYGSVGYEVAASPLWV